MDGGAWWAAVHGVAKSWTRLSDFTFTFHFHALEKEMATQSSVLAWRIPGMAELGGLPSMGLHRVGHDWSDFAAAAAAGDKEKMFLAYSQQNAISFTELRHKKLTRKLYVQGYMSAGSWVNLWDHHEICVRKEAKTNRFRLVEGKLR